MMDDSMSELSLVSWHSGPRSFSLQQRAPSKLPKALFSPIRSSKQTQRRQRYAVGGGDARARRAPPSPTASDDNTNLTGWRSHESLGVIAPEHSQLVASLLSRQERAKQKLDALASTDGAASALEPGISAESAARAHANSGGVILAGENPLGPQYEAVARKRERTLGLRRLALLQSVAAARRTRAATAGPGVRPGVIVGAMRERAPLAAPGLCRSPTKRRGRWGYVAYDPDSPAADDALSRPTPAMSDELLGALHGEPKAARHLHPSMWGSLDPDKLEEVKECRQLMHDVLSNDPADRGKPDPWIARLHGKGWTHVGGK